MSEDELDFEFDFDEDGIDGSHGTFYPSKDDILGIHEDIVSEDEDTEEGLFNDGEGKIEFILQQIKGGIMGGGPDTLHEKALILFKRIASNHPFVDGNKRTALNTTWTFYALNGYHFSYGEEIKAILKLFAVKEEMVDEEEVRSYFAEITYEAHDERVPTYLTQFTHLTKWYSDVSERDYDPSEALMGDVSKEDYKQFIEFFAETYKLTVKLVAFRNNYKDELSEEFIEMVNSEESHLNEFIETLIEEVLAEMPEEEIEEIDGAENEEDIREQLEYMKPENVVEHSDDL